MMRFTELENVHLKKKETEISRKRKWSRSLPADLMSESERGKNSEEGLQLMSTTYQVTDQDLDRYMQTGLYPTMPTAQTFTSRMMRAIEPPKMRTTTSTSAKEDEDGDRETKRRMSEMTNGLNKDNEKVICQKNCEIKALKDQLRTLAQEKTAMKRYYEMEKREIIRANRSSRSLTN
jgi:polyhydroxyalkanoate synthesis regulator phasin